MAGIYGVEIEARHYFEFEAESVDEAEDLAWDAFQNRGDWDDVYFNTDIIEEWDDEDEDDEDYATL